MLFFGKICYYYCVYLHSISFRAVTESGENSYMEKNMVKAQSRAGIRNRIIIFTISALLLTCATVILTSYSIFQEYTEDSLIHSSEASLRLVSDSIDSEMSDINSMVRFCRSNSSVAEYLESPAPDSVLSVSTYNRIYEEYTGNPASSYMPRLAVISEDHFLQIVSATSSSTADLSAEVPALEYFERLLAADNYDFSTGFVKDPFSKNAVPVLPIIRPITYRFSSVQAGYLLLNVSSLLFTNVLCRYQIEDDSRIYLEMPGHCYRYTADGFEEVAPYTVYEQLSAGNVSRASRICRVTDCDGVNTIMVTIPLDMEGCYISQSISLAQLRTQQRSMWISILSILVGIIVIGVVLMYITNSMIAKPVTRLRARMDRIADGDFSRDPSIEWNHELGDIGRGINNLAESIDLLMMRRLEDEKQKNDLEYKMLQSQINPHFIYNTLNSIKWMATVQGSEGISEMTTALSKLLKSLSKGTSLRVTINEELSLLRDYFTIQSYRYGGTIKMDIKCDDDNIGNYSIIKFTLQPIVENAIFHGIEPKGSGHILIHLYMENDMIRIDVIDDGVGMPSHKAASILSDEGENKSDFFRELGVHSVNKRLKFEYGESAGISIESTEGVGTTMTVRLPAQDI